MTRRIQYTPNIQQSCRRASLSLGASTRRRSSRQRRTGQRPSSPHRSETKRPPEQCAIVSREHIRSRPTLARHTDCRSQVSCLPRRTMFRPTRLSRRLGPMIGRMRWSAYHFFQHLSFSPENVICQRFRRHSPPAFCPGRPTGSGSHMKALLGLPG